MKKLGAVLLLSLPWQVLFGQGVDQPPIEEVIVIGELSRPAVRAQIIRVENDIFNFYNEHNGNPKLDIQCQDLAVTGTRITRRICEPVFLLEARARETQEFVYEWSGIAELESLDGKLANEIAQMNAAYAELIQKYPAFAEALLVLQDLKARLEELGN